MTVFEGTVHSVADISARREDVWDAITDADQLAELTPLLDRIEVDGDVWRWHFARIGALGVSVAPVFTEQMTFIEPELISYTHAPPSGEHERSGAEGAYVLTERAGGSHLDITLNLVIDLPLPPVSRSAVRRVIEGTMTATGNRFAANLLRHLHARQL